MYLQKATDHPDTKVFVETAENSCLKIWNPWGCWHLKTRSPWASQGVSFSSWVTQKQFSSLFQPEEEREKMRFYNCHSLLWGRSAASQKQPQSSPVIIFPSCPGAGSLFLYNPQAETTLPCFILLMEQTELCHLAASEGISLLATEKWLCKQWFYLHPAASHFFGSRVSPALIPQGFSYHALLAWTLSPLQILSLQKKKNNAASHWFDIVKLVVFNGFSARGGSWRLSVSWFFYNIVEFKCCWSNIFNQREAFYFQGYRWSILSSLNHIHKGF